MRKIIILVITIGSFGILTAQNVGIGTTTPQAILHIDGQKNNSIVPASLKNYDDVVITSSGNLGVGNGAPITRVDIRSNEKANAIGIGDTNLTAADAGEGAVKYNKVTKTINYSDGINWIALDRGLPKDFILATNPTSQPISSGTTTTITNWTVVTDSNGNFNASTGVFTAKQPGIYVVSFEIGLKSGIINDNTILESIISSNNTTYIPHFKCVNAYPGNVAGVATNIVTSSCSGIFNLNTGETIYGQIKQNLNISKDTEPTLTSISIFGL
ncbi:C1q-like domain-containing protein [Chryseobacterium sp. MEBOG07]|uniref:C1q-like domain-containing protein n=1 Tax=Chryseobacterium sp. MEBOG07 TaxID=2879939 RepID=UPI001F25BE93|nr:hypothetical protein [Chryseobacterium sp. MEBOG07]UKB78343.1 hypothetical protein LF886_17930 [Chryseobacterium sp. MEBOG07]